MYEPESQHKNDAKSWGLPFVPPRRFAAGGGAGDRRTRGAYDVPATVRQLDAVAQPKETYMAKKNAQTGVYRVTEIIGTSKVSWEEAATIAVETAAKSLRDLRVAEVSKLDMKIEGGKVVAYRARVSLSFKYDG